jgi:membrane-associated phospholipid phosphatase
MNYIMDLFLTLFYEIGSYGPAILGISSIYLLRKKRSMFFYYIVGFFINSLLNLVLKGLIQMPRPSEDAGRFNLALTHGRRFLFKNGLPYDVFGMPSGHAQAAFYSCAFIYFSLRNMKILYGYLFLSLVTILQRVIFNYHTPLQVIVGAITGTGIGYAVYYMAKNKLVGRITEKLDDFAPV